MKDQLQFKDLVSRVLTFDYLGALFASLILVRTSLSFELLSGLVGCGAASAPDHAARRGLSSLM